jgi:nucleoside-diphosphate-sugar epimerase
MKQHILITGSCGLVGSALRFVLKKQGIDTQGLDLRGIDDEAGDVRDADRVRAAIGNCSGIIHLAAVSRVIWGERNPALCWATNVDGLRNVLDAALDRADPPWVIFASSREVYGQPASLPAAENTPLQPVNIYGRSKVEGELLVSQARAKGLRAATVRLSNVYGHTEDHADRVVPAFVRAAIAGSRLRVDGADHVFDFTHIDDTARGIVALANHLQGGHDAPLPVHFLTGEATTLWQLATLAVELAGTRASIAQAPPRTFDVSRFYGNPQRALDLLGWFPQVTLCSGLIRLIYDMRAAHAVRHLEEVL